jgi:DNA-binding IclR family transcriptional regulator
MINDVTRKLPVSRSGRRAGAARSEHAAAGTQSIGRALAMLRLVSAAGPAGIKLSDAAARAGLHVATAHRLLAALVRDGFCAQDAASRAYAAGPELLAMAFQAQFLFGDDNRLLPVLERLAEATGEVVYATVRAGDEAVCLARREGSFPIRALPIGPGTRRPLGIGAGSLAILAFLPEAEAAEVMARNAARYVAFGQSEESVAAFVARARREGFALNDGRIIPGMAAVALPVPRPGGPPSAAVSIAAIESRMLPARQQEIVALLRRDLAGLAGGLAPRLDPGG